MARGTRGTHNRHRASSGPTKDRHVQRLPPHRNRRKLIAAAHEECGDVPQARIRTVCNSMRRRCTESVVARGGHTFDPLNLSLCMKEINLNQLCFAEILSGQTNRLQNFVKLSLYNAYKTVSLQLRRAFRLPQSMHLRGLFEKFSAKSRTREHREVKFGLVIVFSNKSIDQMLRESFMRGPGGTEITVTGPCIPGSIQLGQTTLHSTLDPRVFVTKRLGNSPILPHPVPVHLVLPTQSGTLRVSLGNNFTYMEIPVIDGVQPRALNIDGGTRVTVTGQHFAAESDPYLNLTQAAINLNISDEKHTFDAVAYPLTPCSVINNSEMTCRTPKLRLPPTNELGSFKAEYRFGFLFKGFGEYQERDDQRNTTTVLTIEVAPVELPPIAKHHWPPHDVTKREPLTLEARTTKLRGFFEN
ncbi:hypothetical protein CAPTEDRAFT_189669 [Capitella teleta]|uniref:IPT/TIG domain-containing protein n=1 Tax=Capitella teleta TaxID=283909 RepID=R7TKK4_CAPTE|nr:hypothetical protein CAPTEDRAFT_189669 [Capitella teleta]|eukprot:ELT94313.1 hypothetical protein CAPTEDRAFT_189669 [Capitella teleta]